MRHTLLLICCFSVLLTGVLTSRSVADVRSRRILTGLAQPLFATAPPNDSDRLFVMERGGQVRIYDRNSESLLETPFLDVSAFLSTEGEGGLVGMAFHPDYATNGQFYVYYLDSQSNSQISRFEVSGDPNVANAASELSVIGFDQPRSSHNGGWIGFSPTDDYLYIASGDGGGPNDPGGNGQNPNTFLGTMIRLDVDGDDFPADAALNYAVPADNPYVGGGGLPEIWATGLRNPWRSSFDSQTGDLYIADVGQDTREEVNFQRADAAGGANYGWSLREGSVENPEPGVGGPPPAGNVEPVYDYLHGHEHGQEEGNEQFQGHSVTGGNVYRGPDPTLQGKYFFGDFVSGQIWSFDVDRDTEALIDGSLMDWTGLLTPDAGSYSLLTSFGEDGDGNLYATTISGDLFMFEPIPLVASSGAYLNVLYQDVLGRSGDPGGLNYWGTNLSLEALTRPEVARSFLLSTERLGPVVDNFYQAYLGRGADPGGRASWIDQLQMGSSETDVTAAFFTSVEFTNNHASDGAFVDALYHLSLGRAPDSGGRQHYLDALASGMSREEAARIVFRSRERHTGVIDAIYQELLHRPVDQFGLSENLKLLEDNSKGTIDVALGIFNSAEYVYGANNAIGDFDTFIAGLAFSAPATTTATAVPEPAAATLVLIGAVIVTLRRRRR